MVINETRCDNRPPPSRRDFLQAAMAVPAVGLLPAPAAAAIPAPLFGYPRLTFYGATRQVSGSCHLLETSHGLYVVDCGLFAPDIENPEKENEELPFDPKEVKALLLTHAHADHHGRLPLLYKRGFRGKIYCTDATRDLTDLAFSTPPPASDDERDPLFSTADGEAMLKQLHIVPYNKKVQVDKMTVRYTDAGHILGSAMVEVWVDDRKLLFGGDMGPDNSPILHTPTQHYGADCVLLESTYGAGKRTTVDYDEFGRRVAKVLERGGDVLLPTFAIHKAQLLLFTLQRLTQDGVIPAKTPIYCDSATVHKANLIYDNYRDYHDDEAKQFIDKHGSLFYMGKYREGRVTDFLKAHGGTPSIFVSTSGMLAYASSPRHLHAMAGDSRNAVLIPGYQAPNSVGRKLLDGEKKISILIPIDGRTTEVQINPKLEIDRVSGFSSHASGEQILGWLSRFESIGSVFFVHGDEDNSVNMAKKAGEMGVDAHAPKRDESFTIKKDRVQPGPPPELDAPKPAVPAAVDQ